MYRMKGMGASSPVIVDPGRSPITGLPTARYIDCGGGVSVLSGTLCPGVTSVNSALTGCVCGPPGYCYGAQFCSTPQLDSCGRDFRTDPSAGSPGCMSNSTMIGIGAALVVVWLLLFRRG